MLCPNRALAAIGSYPPMWMRQSIFSAPALRCRHRFKRMSIINIDREPVELYKILKFEGLVGSGGEAKLAITAGLVAVNSEIETRKRRKIVDGDTITFGDNIFQIRLVQRQTERAE